MPVLSGSSSGPLAEALAEALGWEHHPLEVRRFPDSEGYVRVRTPSIPAVRSQACVLVANTFPDAGIVETLLMLEAIRDVRAGDIGGAYTDDPEARADPVGPGIILAIPYFGYARQDKRFQQGEPISARAIARVLAHHCDGLTVLDVHEATAFNDLGIPVHHASAIPDIGDHLSARVRPDMVLSPDKGAIGIAREVAEQIGCEFSYLEKRRIDAHTVEHQAKDLDVDGKVVAIVDDMISTGGTIMRATEALRRQGARAVHAATSHGLFTGGAIERLESVVDGLHATDSLPNPRAVISAAPGFARAIQRFEWTASLIA